MFDIGFSELLLVFVVTLLIVGPEKLPTVARKMGRFVGKIKRAFDQVRHDVEQELEIEAVKQQLKENAMAEEVRQIADEAKQLAGHLNETIGDDSPPERKNNRHG